MKEILEKLKPIPTELLSSSVTSFFIDNPQPYNIMMLLGFGDMGNLNQESTINVGVGLREVLFRGKNEATGEWVEGSYHHRTKKGGWYGISPNESNEIIKIHKESLEIRESDDIWVKI